MVEIFYSDFDNDTGLSFFELVYKNHILYFNNVIFNEKGKIEEYDLAEIQDFYGISVNLELSEIEVNFLLCCIELQITKN